MDTRIINSHSTKLTEETATRIKTLRRSVEGEEKKRLFGLILPFPTTLRLTLDANSCHCLTNISQSQKSIKYHKLFNRNNIEISYSCLPNMGKVIKGQYKTVLAQKEKKSPEKRNSAIAGKILSAL